MMNDCVGSWVGPLQTVGTRWRLTVLLLAIGAVTEVTLDIETEATGNALDRWRK